jgi:hypothetical protein
MNRGLRGEKSTFSCLNYVEFREHESSCVNPGIFQKHINILSDLNSTSEHSEKTEKCTPNTNMLRVSVLRRPCNFITLRCIMKHTSMTCPSEIKFLNSVDDKQATT